MVAVKSSKHCSVGHIIGGVVAACLLLLDAHSSSAAWSVLAVDGSSGATVIASASCVPQEAFDRIGAAGLLQVEAVVVPGKGVAVIHGTADRTNRDKALVFDQLKASSDPSDIGRLLMQSNAASERQYSILDVQGRHSSADSSQIGGSRSEYGRVPLTQSSFVGSGNLLRYTESIAQGATAFVSGNGSISYRALSAIAAVDVAGGDSRCSCQSVPRSAAPCLVKHAQVAYLMIADREDPAGNAYNDGHYRLFLYVSNANIGQDEDANPITTLRHRYDAWKHSHGDVADY